MIAEVRFEVVLEDGLQVAAHTGPAQGRIDAVDRRHPAADHTVRYAAGSVLVLRPLPLQQPVDLATVGVHLVHESGEGLVLEPAIGDTLFVVGTVPQVAIQIGGAPFPEFIVACRVLGFADVTREFGHRRQGAQIEARTHPVGSPELDVIRVVMGFLQDAPVLRVPGADAVVHAALRQGVHALEPRLVAADLPLPIHFHDAAELTIRCGVELVLGVAIREGGAEGHVAAAVHGSFEFGLAEGSFQLWIQVGQSLGIVPDVGTRSRTAAVVDEASLPGPGVAVFLQQQGRRFEDGQIGGHCVDDVGGEGGFEEGIVKALRAGSQ